MEKAIVNPDLYSMDYFLTDNEGWREYMAGLDLNTHPKFEKALRLANPSKGDNVLDIGCGRGELLYYCAKRGAKVLGIDYSEASVEITKETIRRLPPDIQHLASCDVGDITTYNLQEKYSIIFMIEIIEHMHDWQLIKAFGRIKEILTENGKLIIMTPNYYYERYLSPAKRVMNMPLNLVKWPIRILRNKYKPESVFEVLHKIFKIRVDRGKLNKMIHVNISTPSKLKGLLCEFDREVWCEDHSKNILSLIVKRWCGREIVAVAKRR